MCSESVREILPPANFKDHSHFFPMLRTIFVLHTTKHMQSCRHYERHQTLLIETRLKYTLIWMAEKTLVATNVNIVLKLKF